MQLTEKEKETILNAYNYGDYDWLETILKIVETKENNETVMKLLNILFKMNFIIVETEQEDYAGKYNVEAYNLYSEMKIDLTKMLDYEEMWEVL